jgi:MYXO-CTERM domain-containing protein
MGSNFLRQAALGSLLLVGITGISAAPVQAATQDVDGTPVDTGDDNGFDEGLLGLAGLAGLLGLRRRDQQHVDRSDANRTATSRV